MNGEAELLPGAAEKLAVIGEWGVLEIAANPTANFMAGITGLRAMFTMDVGVRYAGSFGVSTSTT